MKPKIFIGSSTENLYIAKAVQVELDHTAYTTIWTQDIFKLTSTTLDDLLIAINNFDFAIFIFNPEDITKIRKQEYQTVRDNVIFELGLFLGRLNDRKKVFILKPRSVEDLHLPSDLAGLTLGDYDNTRIDEIQASIGPFCTKVENQIKQVQETGILSLRGKWCERWKVEEIDNIHPDFSEDNDVLIEQIGSKISAHFRFQNRTYLLEGVIEQMRFVTGTWRDIETGPTYSGAFQLKININANTMVGKWVGFSAKNNTVQSGIWEWKRSGIEGYPPRQ